MLTHVPGHLVAHGIEEGAAVMVDHSLGVAGGPRGVVETDRIPLSIRPLPDELGIAFGKECLVIQGAVGLSLAVLRVVYVDYQRWVIKHADSGVHDIEELAIGDQYLGFTVLQHEGDGLGIQAYVQSIEHRPDHRDTEMRFEHFRNVRQHDRYRVALANASALQRRSQTTATVIGLGPGAPNGTVYHGRVVRIDVGSAFDETEGRQGGMVDRTSGQAFLIYGHGSYPWHLLALVDNGHSRMPYIYGVVYIPAGIVMEVLPRSIGIITIR